MVLSSSQLTGTAQVHPSLARVEKGHTAVYRGREYEVNLLPKTMIELAVPDDVADEVVLIIMGGVFVVETLSVMIQVASFKMTGKRVFRMAPIHHHYELKGWKENQVVVRFWIITMLLVLFGLSTLKLR